MLKKQMNALMRIAHRGEASRGMAYGILHGEDRRCRKWYMVTDSHMMVAYPSRKDLDDELLPHVELPCNGFAKQLAEWTELDFEYAVPSAMLHQEPSMQEEYKRVLELTKAAKRARADGPMEWEPVQEGIEHITGWFDPVLVFDALEAIGHNASVYIGIAGSQMEYPILAVCPEDCYPHYPGEYEQEPVAIILPVKRRM